MTKSEWTQRFIKALASWKSGKRSFLRDGGVPGYLIPSNSTPESLAQWFLAPGKAFNDDPRHPDHECYSPNLLTKDPAQIIEDMQNADNAYTPDY